MTLGLTDKELTMWHNDYFEKHKRSKPMSNSSYIISGNTMTLFHAGRVYVAHKEHKLWNKLIRAVSKGKWDKAVNVIDRMQAVREWVSKSGNLAVHHESVAYQGRILPNAITKRILEMIDNDFDTGPIENFLKNLFDNPSNRSVEELYRFLECNSLPITEDGHFLAYKRVREDWTDTHSGTISNTVGTTVEMPRNQVDDDKDRTCSAGLHFASLGYLRSFWGDRLIALKINPKDVVSIPVDYNNTKGRCCKYEVVAELDMSIIEENRDEWDSPVANY